MDPEKRGLQLNLASSACIAQKDEIQVDAKLARKGIDFKVQKAIIGAMQSAYGTYLY